ncbi:hypothetical protein [Chitinilyticum piscinae]|uniref:Uncharacterized protein n=1 Tax=Chitinilyticum piscinae TaxID=2866724 RepID=A0A8J7FXD4_9NEIS|nr:hypothetical protein [Chitinilyticum piscinae]MBE9608390.1 hypothetical protein [Chitinilyticum piscinae]
MPVDESAHTPPVAKPRTPRLDIVLRWLIGLFVLLAILLLATMGGARGWDGLAYLIGAIAAGGVAGLLLVVHVAIIRGLPTRQRKCTLISLAVACPLLTVLAIAYTQQRSRIGEPLPDEQHSTEFKLAGAIFPKGGTVHYVQGGLFSKKAIAIHASAPGQLGDLQLSALELAYPNYDEEIIVTLTRPQTIDGWHCDSAFPVVLLRDGKWQLRECTLASKRHAGQIDWPAGTRYSSSELGMRLNWPAAGDEQAEGCQQAISALGYRFSALDYQPDQNSDKGDYSGTLCDPVAAGPYTFKTGANFHAYSSGSSAISGQTLPEGAKYESGCVEKARPEEPFRKCGSSAGQDAHAAP